MPIALFGSGSAEILSSTSPSTFQRAASSRGGPSFVLPRAGSQHQDAQVRNISLSTTTRSCRLSDGIYNVPNPQSVGLRLEAHPWCVPDRERLSSFETKLVKSLPALVSPASRPVASNRYRRGEFNRTSLIISHSGHASE